MAIEMSDEWEVEVSSKSKKYKIAITRMYYFGKTPIQTFLDSQHIAIKKQLNRSFQTTDSVLVAA